MLNHSNINSFTVLRLLGAFLVLLSHSFDLLGINEPLETIYGIKFSKIGLWIFFSISGYLISSSALHSKSIFSYIWKRFLRIFPALIIVTVLSIIVIGPIFTTLPIQEYLNNKDSFEYLSNILLYRNQYSLPGVFLKNIEGSAVNGSLWTLAYEFTFYLMASLLIFIPVYCRKFWSALILIFMTSLYLVGWFKPLLTVPFFYLNVKALGEFGVLFSIGMICQTHKFHKLKPNVFQLISIAVFALLLLIINSHLLLPFFAPFIILIGLQKSVFSIIDKIGDISYGMYLYAFPIQQSIISINPMISPIVLLLTSTTLAACFGYLSWIFIEKPSLKLKSLI